MALEPWIGASLGIGASLLRFALAAGAVAGLHFALRMRQRRVIEEHCQMQGLEDDEEDFPMKLGLRY